MHSSHSSKEQNVKIIGDYYLKQTIGRGTFSKVKLGINKYTNQKVAIKLLKKSKIIEKDDLERIIREMAIYKELSHENVIEVFNMFETNDYYMIIMKYYEGGELFNYIVDNDRLSEEESAYFFYQIINGVEYIHSKGITHRDLKPENLLLDKEKKLKIIDFGLSNYFNGEDLLKTPCGSPCYASPEMVSHNKYNGFKIDIWAIGIILYAMLCGYLPFEDDDNNILFHKILECKLEYPRFLSKLSKDIINKILVTDPNKRFTIKDIKKHNFYLLGKKVYEERFKLYLNIDNEFERKSYTANHTNENLPISEINNDNKENKVINEIKELINSGYDDNKSKFEYNNKIHIISHKKENKENENDENINFLNDYISNRIIGSQNNKVKKIPNINFLKGKKKGEERTKTQTNSIIKSNNNKILLNNFNNLNVNSSIQDNYKVELTDITRKKPEIINLKKKGYDDLLNIYKISTHNMDKKKVFIKPFNQIKFNSNENTHKIKKFISQPKNKILFNNLDKENFFISKKKPIENNNLDENKLPLINNIKKIKFNSQRSPLNTEINLYQSKLIKNKIKSNHLKESFNQKIKYFQNKIFINNIRDTSPKSNN